MTDTITLPRAVMEQAIDTIGYYASVAGEDDQDTPAKQMQAALRAAIAQQAEQVHDGNTCSNCTFHYKDIDMKPCSNCERGDNIEDNWMPMSTGQIALAEAPKGGV